ncbi:chromosome segregation ATPase [Vibrio antiquarius]|uniref:chromosome segregation ATPase n=1 Tax=Vibrio antiquarius (strain Ex25) TaxID=150340 RepID=UPI0026592963|nr:chromosome segregation ATPase [Vibrio antiquarius]MCR9846586.1 chromosome segregation ATPase [Vibrio antiquarius]MCR9912463.1 chromosome segregation ATPase [Vibrio antiquarius]
MKLKYVLQMLILFLGNSYYSYSKVENLSMSEQLEVYVYNTRIIKDTSDSLVGIDLDRNSIRDDVDKAISYLSVSEVDKEFVSRYVKYATKILEYNFKLDRLENKLVADELYKEHIYIKKCYKESGVDGKELYDSINALNVLIFNTETRIMAYLYYEKYLDIRQTYMGVSYDCKNSNFYQI